MKNGRVEGLTLVHFSAQRQHLLWEMLGGFSVLEAKMSEVDVRSGRVDAPAVISAYHVENSAPACMLPANSPLSRGLHSSTSQLDVSTLSGIRWVY